MARPRLQDIGWYEWLSHSNFSFLVGASHPHELIDRALNFAYRGLALTDYDGVYGLARAHLHWTKWRKHQHEAALVPLAKEAGTDELGANAGKARSCATAFRLYYGAELHLAPDHHLPLVQQDTLVLVAQTAEGYRNLCRLCSESHRGGKKNAHLAWSALCERPVAGLVAIQPMRGLMRQRGRTQASTADLERRSAAIAAHFAGRYYVAVSRHLSPAEDRWIAPTLRLAQRLGLPCLLSQDVFFHEAQRKRMSDLLQALRTNESLERAVAQMFVNGERHLHKLAVLERLYGDLPIYESALRASRELAESCQFDLGQLRYSYPREMLPPGESAQSFLERLSWQAARRCYGASLPEAVADILRHELALIARLEFADYFLTVWDIVRWARSRQILCQGRGSAANSAVCFVLGITAVDPASFDMLFERFLSVERGDPPDIDVDFEHERREEVIQYIYERYGRRRAAMVANVITFRLRGALRAVGKALAVPGGVLDKVARCMDERHAGEQNAGDVLQRAWLAEEEGAASQSWAKERAFLAPERRREGAKGAESEPWGGPPHLFDGAASNEKACSSLPPVLADGLDRDEDGVIPWQLWADMTQQLVGFPRHLGIHSGGFIIADRDLDELVAQEPATMPGRSVVQWCKEDIEGLGFFKIDILALGILSALRKSFASIAKHYGRHLRLDNLPAEDRATYEMIARADTVGTFQIESRAQMAMLPRLRPRTFYDLVVEIAIIRPGPIQGGMVHPYLRRRDGIEAVTFPDERLRPILQRTLGIPIFQEQVMRIAMAVGDFTPGQANELRRHMGAWSVKGGVGPWLERLAEGMRRNGLAAHFIEVIVAQMRGFADYGFPESHAVSFAFLAYASAYLKCHYPAAFFTALLNSQPMGFYAPHVLVHAARQQGVVVLPVCVQVSTWDVTLENQAPAGQAPVWGIRLGLRCVRGLRETAALSLIATRQDEGGAWRDVASFLRRARLHRPDLTALAAAGALASLGIARRAALWLAEAVPFCPTLEDVEEPIHWEEESALERVEQDFAATGISLGAHPTTIIRAEHWCYEVSASKLFAARALEKMAAGQQVLVFGMVLVRQAPPSAKGMVFLTLEDASGFINAVCHPHIYQRFHRLIERQAFLCLKGRLERQREAHAIVVEKVYEPRLDQAAIIELAQHLAPEPPPNEQVAAAVTERRLNKARNYL